MKPELDACNLDALPETPILLHNAIRHHLRIEQIAES